MSAGANGPDLNLLAENIGDGKLNVSALPNVPWLVAFIGQQGGCNQVGGQCIAVRISLNTSSLQKGTYTGTVTFTAPNALDSPQTVTVTVAVGGAVPDQLTFYVPANGSPVSQAFTTSTRLTGSATSPTNGPSIAVAMASGGSFGNTITYNVTATSRTGVAEGKYDGSIAFSGSTVAAENKTVPVSMTVTSQPIASGPAAPVRLRIAQGAAKQTSYYPFTNAGAGTMTLSGAMANTTSGGDWLAGSVFANYAGVTVDPATLSPGNYEGTVTVASNAVNTITIPVQLEVVASGPPLTYAGGVVSNADFAPGPLAPGDLPAVFGEQFTTGAAQSAPSLPLPKTLGGATVLINNNPVPIYYVSANQINFQIPYEAALGDAVLRVDREGQRGNDVYLRINRSAPRLHSATLGSDKVAAANSAPLAPVKRGDTIVLWALGLGPTTPLAESGVGSPSSPLATVSPAPPVIFGTGNPDTGGATVTPDFAGLTPTFVGLYQINVRIPQNAPVGASVPLTVRGQLGVSNKLQLNIR